MRKRQNNIWKVEKVDIKRLEEGHMNCESTIFFREID